MTRPGDVVGTAEWDSYGSHWVDTRPQQSWRRHSDAVNVRLIEEWLPRRQLTRILKTDLFDEAVSEGICPMLLGRASAVVGIDVSVAVLREAGRSCESLSCSGSDVRALPFRSEVFDAVVSLSTLDHFPGTDEVQDAVKELYRVLVPGGVLVLTLDNLANPVIALRNSLPYRLTHAAGLVPYPVGRTFRPEAARALVEGVGFRVSDLTAVMHAPRVIAIPLMSAFSGKAGGRAERLMLRAAMRLEALRDLWSRFRTGHFIAIRAEKPLV
ncbi:MAG: class I SAM-dependent methyltransferase [Gemmatimonadaceae bacterium]